MGDAYLIPKAVMLAAERIRADAANTMRHDTTADLTPRLMCRVAVSDVGLVMAWIDQHRRDDVVDPSAARAALSKAEGRS